MTNDEIERINSLPESLDRQRIEDEFIFLIKLIKRGLTEEDSILILSALNELADKQWETYELLDKTVKDNLDELILKVWDKRSLDSTEKLICVMVKLGLSSTFSLLTAIDPKNLSSEVRQEIASAILEVGENIEDPYSGMK